MTSVTRVRTVRTVRTVRKIRTFTTPPMSSEITRELIRKALHAGVGVLAFAVVVIGPGPSAAMVFALLVFNLVVLSRGEGRLLWRRVEVERGAAVGIVAYPAAVLALILIFWRHLEVAAAVWAILAFGDGMATVFGVVYGRRGLPWNPRKTWAGSFAYWFFGTLGAGAVLAWSAFWHGQAISWIAVTAVAGLAALFAAWLESQPQGLDDNLTVPLPTALVVLGLLQSLEASGFDFDDVFVAAIGGFILQAVLAAVAWQARAIDLSGAVAGCVLGTAIFAALGWRGWLLLVAFVFLGSAATRVGFDRKEAAGVSQSSGGRRSARNVIANAGVAAVAAVFAATTPFRDLYIVALAGAFAAAASDTLSSELGQLWGRRTILITTLRPVSSGTDGGLSFAGSLAGVAGSLMIAGLGWFVGLYPSSSALAVFLAGIAGSIVDSLLGATLERRGELDNQGVNFAATLAGAAVAVGLAVL